MILLVGVIGFALSNLFTHRSDRTRYGSTMVQYRTVRFRDYCMGW